MELHRRMNHGHWPSRRIYRLLIGLAFLAGASAGLHFRDAPTAVLVITVIDLVLKALGISPPPTPAPAPRESSGPLPPGERPGCTPLPYVVPGSDDEDEDEDEDGEAELAS